MNCVHTRILDPHSHGTLRFPSGAATQALDSQAQVHSRSCGRGVEGSQSCIGQVPNSLRLLAGPPPVGRWLRVLTEPHSSQRHPDWADDSRVSQMELNQRALHHGVHVKKIHVPATVVQACTADGQISCRDHVKGLPVTRVLCHWPGQRYKPCSRPGVHPNRRLNRNTWSGGLVV